MKSVMYAVNGDQTVAKPYGASEVYIVNGDTSVPKPAGVSEVYLANGDTSIPRPAGVSEVYADEGDLTIAKPDGVSVVSITNYSSEPPVPPVPVLPDNTIRIKYQAGYTPTMGDTQTLIDADENIWDIYKASNNWARLFSEKSNLLEVIGANTSSVTDMDSMFIGCKSLTSIPLFDTSSVTNMYGMFDRCSSLESVPLLDTSSVKKMGYMFFECTSLKSVPLLDTSKVTDMRYMFQSCYNVESGALALYRQASSQATPPSEHAFCFRDCGGDTVTGAAELAQIPSDWK